MWVDATHDQACAAAELAGLTAEIASTPMVAVLDDRAATNGEGWRRVDFATAGRLNDAAYASATPSIELAIAGFPDTVHTYGAADDHGEISAVALAYDHGYDDTAVWFVATAPEAQGQGLGRRVMTALLDDARRRGSRTASLQASAAGRRLYESLGFESVGALALYEQAVG